MKQLAIGIALGAAGALALQGGPALANYGKEMFRRADAPASGAACSRDEEARNKAIVAQLKPGSAQFHAILAPDYVQHSPEYARFAAINGVADRAAVKLLERIAVGKTAQRLRGPAAGQPPTNPSYKVIAECDMVVAVVQHWELVPDQPDKFYAAYFFNMWRLKDGKLLEHWDPDEIPSPLPEYLKKPVSELTPPSAPDDGAQ